MKDSPSILSPSSSRFSGWNRTEASVLLITLSFILLLTVIAVAFLVRSRSSLQTSQSYTKEIVAQEIGEIAIDKIAAEFQDEINTARSSTNQMLLPPRVGAITNNPRESALVRRTMGDTNLYASGYSTAGFSPPPHANRASTISTTNVAKNGWRFDRERWFAPGLLRSTETNTFVPPDWVYIYRTQTTNASDIIGRYAAVVYDVGGLLDVNEAGVPSGVSLGDKGSVAFADLTAFSTIAPDLATKLPAWRFAGSAADETAFYGNSTVTDPTKAGRLESPKAKVDAGENRFFSRMELVEAAKAGKFGLSEDLLPFLRTRSESANHVSVENLFADGTTTPIGLADDKLEAKNDTPFTIDRIDGTQDTYTIKAGWPLIQNRFPLARLRWLADREADGTPKHPNEIKKYFGLTWNSTDKLFVYTSPDSNTAVDEIKTLVDLVDDINSANIPPREPDFFEWLKAGIDPNSLGQTGGTTDRIFSDSMGAQTPWEVSKDLHLLRIGANIIDQSDPDSIPTGIRFTGEDARAWTSEPFRPFDSFGQENLPYLNEVVASCLRDGDYLKGYLQFEMWNPNRNAASLEDPPRDYQGNAISNFRVRAIQGCVYMEPYVYVQATSGNNQQKEPNYRIKRVSGQTWGDPEYTNRQLESYNSAWSNLKWIAEYSKRNLQASDFDAVEFDENSTSVNFTLNTTGDFFVEPYLANGNQQNGQDKTGDPATAMMNLNPTVRLGSAPIPGSNAILAVTVRAPNPAISAGFLLSSIYYSYKNTNPGDPLPSTPPPYPPLSAAEQITYPKGVIPSKYTELPLGAKAFNAVAFYSDGTAKYGVQSKPVTFVVELQDGTGTWRACQIYNNLAINCRADGGQGKQAAILSSDPNTHSQSNWTSSSDTTSRCFGNWREWETRKGFPNTDPRTERFGLTDQIFASPGLSIRTHLNAWDPTASGNDWNLPNGLTSSVGTSFAANASTSNEGPAPHWAIQDAGAANVSVPADLALNVGAITGTPGNYHSYSDFDDKVRPADARWVPAEAHPALPLVTYPNALKSRPAMLDRPFRNVAELGFVFRDIPWKSLDLFSPDQSSSDSRSGSPDRRLLDIFSIEDGPTQTGKINPNTTDRTIFQALLNGAALDPSGKTVSTTDPTATVISLAENFSALDSTVTSEAVHNVANMAKRISEDSNSKPDRSDKKFAYKAEAENFIRALSSTTETRSWQLMLDVVAQAGRIAPQSVGLSDKEAMFRDFLVEGQRRFFVYLTVDRITGEIVDKHVEPVYE